MYGFVRLYLTLFENLIQGSKSVIKREKEKRGAMLEMLSKSSLFRLNLS